MTACLIEHFSLLDDPRIDRKKLHKLIDIIVLSVCAVVSDADGWEAIEGFGKEKLDWQRKFVPRLSGMTESLANRNREAIEHQLSYPEFLALLVQNEVARREQKKYAMRIRRAGFRIKKTLESFDL